ncbi:MAG: site-specific integrase, partial [Parvularculaceae bacterium]|nr:site-specific integrase [Parvularculaceae bacterium]
MTIAEVAMRYWSKSAQWDRAGQLRSVAAAGTIRRNLEIAIEKVGELTVSQFNKARQQEFARELAEKYRPATIRRVFDMMFAALNYCFDAEELDRVPPRIRLPDSPPKEYVASLDEIAKFWDAEKPPQIQVFLVLLLATGARPSTVLQLTRFQCDLERGIVDLNPPGRIQTAKRRPVIPMCRVLREWIESANEGPLVHYNGRAIEYPNQSWRRVRRSLGMSESFTPGAMRHTVASELRRQGVPPAQIAGLLGHTMPNWRTTERYAKYDPRFMAETVEALDRFFDDIALRTETSLTPKRVSSVLVTERGSDNPLIYGGRDKDRTCDPYGVN